MAKLNQYVLTILLGVLVLFLNITFDPTYGNIVLWLIGLTAFAYFYHTTYEKDVEDYPVERTESNRLNSLFVALIVFIVFSFVAPILTKIFTSQTLSLTQILSVFSSSTLIFADNKYIMVLSMVVIAVAENNFFFGALFETIEHWAGRLVGNNWKTWATIAVTTTIFTLYHLQAKGAGGPILFVVFLFGVTQGLLLWYYREQKQGILNHAITNGVAMSIAVFGLKLG